MITSAAPHHASPLFPTQFRRRAKPLRAPFPFIWAAHKTGEINSPDKSVRAELRPNLRSVLMPSCRKNLQETDGVFITGRLIQQEKRGEEECVAYRLIPTVLIYHGDFLLPERPRLSVHSAGAPFSVKCFGIWELRSLRNRRLPVLELLDFFTSYTPNGAMKRLGKMLYGLKLFFV